MNKELKESFNGVAEKGQPRDPTRVGRMSREELDKIQKEIAASGLRDPSKIVLNP